MGRVANILQLGLRYLDDVGERKISKQELAFHLSQVELEICQRALPLKSRKSITTVDGLAEYQLGPSVFRVLSCATPASWPDKLEFIQSPEEWAEIVGHSSSRKSPVYAIVWTGGVLELYPAPSKGGDILNLACALFPDDLNETSEDPSLSAEWDTALVYGMVARINGDFSDRYESEVARLLHQTLRNSVVGAQRMRHWSDELGF
jgi:hypothetical protein